MFLLTQLKVDACRVVENGVVPEVWIEIDKKVASTGRVTPQHSCVYVKFKGYHTSRYTIVKYILSESLNGRLEAK